MLNQRLDDRVEDMLERGLLNELQQFHIQYNEQRLSHYNINVHCTNSTISDDNLKGNTSKAQKRVIDDDHVNIQMSANVSEPKKQKLDTDHPRSDSPAESVTTPVNTLLVDPSKHCSYKLIEDQLNTSHLKANGAYTLGIFQSIGFKEFHEYLILPEGLRDTDQGQILYNKGVASLKLVRTFVHQSQKNTYCEFVVNVV